jgi:pilus assembly protein CpaE
MDTYPVLVVGAKPEILQRLTTAFGHQQVRAAEDAAAARASLQKARPASAVVPVGTPALTDSLHVVAELAGQGVPVVAIGARKDPDVILAAMRAGAREYLLEGEDERLEKTIHRFLESSGHRLGSITAVFPAKGGMGATTIATNLAGVLSRRGNRVCLADLDLELGDVLSFLDLKGTYSLADVAMNAKRLDRDLLDSSVPRHAAGMWVLSQCEKVEDGDRLEAGGVGGVLRFLRPLYHHVILDGLRDLGDVSLASLDLADRILLVTTQEVPAVRSAQRCAQIFRKLGYDRKQVMLVVNRYQKGSTITREVIEETVGMPVAAMIGNDFASLSRAVNAGALVWDEAPRSVVARDIEALARAIGPEAPDAAAPERASFLRKIFSRPEALHGAE